jgi:hypothetical protein
MPAAAAAAANPSSQTVCSVLCQYIGTESVNLTYVMPRQHLHQHLHSRTHTFSHACISGKRRTTLNHPVVLCQTTHTLWRIPQLSPTYCCSCVCHCHGCWQTQRLPFWSHCGHCLAFRCDVPSVGLACTVCLPAQQHRPFRQPPSPPASPHLCLCQCMTPCGAQPRRICSIGMRTPTRANRLLTCPMPNVACVGQSATSTFTRRLTAHTHTHS